MMRVAFQGDRGAYSELAARQALGDSLETVPCRSFDEVFELVEKGGVERGIVPIENSLAGTIRRNYDLLLRHSLRIVGEHSLPVRHCLIAHPSVELADVEIAVSHPQALAQCERRLVSLGIEPEPAYDTAGAVRSLSDGARKNAAAIASSYAAEVFNMRILQANLQDYPHNFTRFLVLSREPLAAAEGDTELSDDAGQTKISIAFSLQSGPGTLFKALAVFALRDLDLAKLESRPNPERPWDYLFYLDFLTNDPAGAAQRSLAHLEEIASMLTVLGTYPAQKIPEQAGLVAATDA
jgi:arogenate/prephenate dehydratase